MMNLCPIPLLSLINPMEILIFLSKINCLLKNDMAMNNLVHNDMAGKASIYFTNMAGKISIYLTNKQTVIYMKITILKLDIHDMGHEFISFFKFV